MTTNSNIAKRTRMTGKPVVYCQPSARYQGTDEGRVNWLSPSPFNPGVGLTQEHAFRLEGMLGRDRRQIQI